jgi:hypothetical protein
MRNIFRKSSFIKTFVQQCYSLNESKHETGGGETCACLRAENPGRQPSLCKGKRLPAFFFCAGMNYKRYLAENCIFAAYNCINNRDNR